MRDVIIVILVTVGVISAIRRPWVGVMYWTFFSIANPHTQTWGFAQSLPVAASIAGATFLGMVFGRERRNPFLDPAVFSLLLFMVWIAIGWPFSFYPDESVEMLSKVLKVDLMVLVTVALVIKKEQIGWLVWVTVLSLAVYGVKGGLFTIATGGSYRVWGPGGFIGGNNEVALAFVIVIPLMYYLYETLTKKWWRRAMLASMVLTAAAALGSHSRGALLAIVAMAIFLWWRSKNKMFLGAALVVAGIVALAFMPDNWTSRMQTIQTYDKDESAMGRINAWMMAWNLAADRPLTGGGFAIYEPAIFETYAPDPLDIHAAHSIYFQVLGEHGWVGFLIWLSIWWYTWRCARWLQRHGGRSPETAWCRSLGAMCQVSIVGYAVGGAFLSLAYFDLPYNVMIMVVTAKAWIQARERTLTTTRVSDRPMGVSA